MMEETNSPVPARQGEEMEKIADGGKGGRKKKPKKPRGLSWLLLLLVFFLFLELIDSARGIAVHLGKKEFQPAFISLLPILLIFALFYSIVRRIIGMRDQYRERLETPGRKLKVKEALVFALTWSFEIYKGIPDDRRPLINSAYLLLLGVVGIMVIEAVSIGRILLSLLLILAATNLLVWAVGSERQEKNRIEVELDTARRMQMSLMPASDFRFGPIEISGYCQPSFQVGGDSFDYIHFSHQPQRVTVSVVDVSGKGMAAALTAVYASGAINSEIRNNDHVEEAASRLNTAICCRKQKKQFISLLLAEIDIRNRRLAFINAGQSRPLLLRDGGVAVLKGDGPPLPLGVVEDVAYQRSEVELRGGDTLLFHTDGVTDMVNEQGDMFGNERLHGLLAELGGAAPSAKDLVEAMRGRLALFSGSAPQFDDITLVAMRVAT
jgi:serine phosphatase RsbU (regulator of sigma subunit)